MKPNNISLPPTIFAQGGRAWTADMEVWKKKNEIQKASVCVWIVEAKWAHPMWHSYMIWLVHLRSEPDLPKPVIHLANATHEMLVFALHPEADLAQFLADGRPQLFLGKQFFPILSPGNFAAQIIAESDDAAIKRVEKAVREICDFRLSPDTDFLHQWIARFGDNMIKDPWKPPKSGVEQAMIWPGKGPKSFH